MNIKDTVYEQLSPQERVQAAVMALARDDGEETRRLIRTCPRKNYTCTDAAFGDRMDLLFHMALGIEVDLRGQAIQFLAAYALEDKEGMIDAALAMVTDYQAWSLVLDDLGLDMDLFEKAYPIRAGCVSSLLDMLPEPDPEAVQAKKQEYWNVLEKNGHL